MSQKMEFLNWMINEGFNRVEFIDYPEDAVREAIVNALVHRDYGIIGSEIHIDMYETIGACRCPR